MERILEDLVRHADDVTRPEVDLYLASGPVLRGRVIAVRQGLATVHTNADAELLVSYVRVDHIIAITVIGGQVSHHDNIITPVNEMSFAAMQAAMAVPTPPGELAQHDEQRTTSRTSEEIRRLDIVQHPEERTTRRPTGEMPRVDEMARHEERTRRRVSEDMRWDGDARRSSDEGGSDVRRSSTDVAAARERKARAEASRAELARSEAARGDAARGDVARGDVARRESSQHERVDVVRGEISRSDVRAIDRRDRRDSSRREESARVDRRDGSRLDRDGGHGEVSAAFSAMRVETGSIPVVPTDPVAEFVASQYDVVTPAEPIAPLSLELPRSGPDEAPTYLGDRPPQPRVKVPTPVSPSTLAASDAASAAVEATFSMRSETPRPKTVPRPPSPSRPELMRLAGMNAELLSRTARRRVEIAIGAPLDDDSRRAIGYALPVASDVLIAMFGEARRGLERITSVELVAGDVEVVADGARLVIRCSLVDRWSPPTLRAAVERATARG